MLTVAPDRSEEHQPARHFAIGVRDHLFQMPDLDLNSLPEASTSAFARAFSDPVQAHQALQLLTVMPYISGQLHDDEIAHVQNYADALNIEPNALQDLNNIAHGHIKRALMDYSRRVTSEFLPGGIFDKARGLVREVHSLVGDKKRAAKFEQLSELPVGTLGKTLHSFYRARGFSFPGEKGNIGESAVRHDCVHILSGTNTSMAGEIVVGAIEAGMSNSEVGWEMATEVLVDFHLGISWTLTAGIQPGTMNFDPDLFSRGLALGGKINTDLIRDWNYQDHLNETLSDLRERFNISGVEIIDMPAPEKDPNAQTTYWN